MKKPVIGIVIKPGEKVSADLWNRMEVQDEIRYLIVKNGGVAISILSTENTMAFNDNDIDDKTILTDEQKEDLRNIVNLCDGIVLQGGLMSCNYEIEIAKIAIQLDKPLIGICAGFNNILRALGSNVILDNTKKHDVYDINYRHEISIEKDTMLSKIIGKEKINVNSIHSMVATKEIVESVAKVSSYSNDGLVESFELSNKKFVLAVKWHPELMLQEDYVDKLFKEFVNKCSH